jgi:hypothetical protein
MVFLKDENQSKKQDNPLGATSEMDEEPKKQDLAVREQRTPRHSFSKEGVAKAFAMHLTVALMQLQPKGNCLIIGRLFPVSSNTSFVFSVFR